METSGVLTGASRTLDGKKMLLTFEVDSVEQNYIEEIRQYEKASIKVTKFRQKRSLDANAYYWQLITKLAEALKISKSRTHNIVLRKYGQREYIDGSIVTVPLPDTENAENKALEADTYHLKPTSQVRTGNDGIVYRTYVMLRGSSEYNTKEMSELIDGLVSECKELGIETATPDELERMKREWNI